MFDDPSRPASDDGGPPPADAGLLALVYRVAVECTGHRDERVRVAAGGTLEAAFWTTGEQDVAPVTRRRGRWPQPRQVLVEYLAARQLCDDAETDVQYADARGVADWLALVGGVECPDEPWWWPVLDAVPERQAARATP